jgi:hypothetical protein
MLQPAKSAYAGALQRCHRSKEAAERQPLEMKQTSAGGIVVLFRSFHFSGGEPIFQRLAPGEDCGQGSSERWVSLIR